MFQKFSENSPFIILLSVIYFFWLNFIEQVCNSSYLYHGSVGGRNRGGRGHDGLVGTTVKIRQGAYKGYRGRVVEVKGNSVRVELESQMKVVTGKSFWDLLAPSFFMYLYGS